jgi:hypothetical protein
VRICVRACIRVSGSKGGRPEGVYRVSERERERERESELGVAGVHNLIMAHGGLLRFLSYL